MSREGNLRSPGATASCCASVRPHGRVPPTACVRLVGDLEDLATTGWRNYSLFMRNDRLLVGSVEADDLQASQAAMARTEVNA
jgi:hypothetical protein